VCELRLSFIKVLNIRVCVVFLSLGARHPTIVKLARDLKHVKCLAETLISH
jgi:hypothetical protein